MSKQIIKPLNVLILGIILSVTAGCGKTEAPTSSSIDQNQPNATGTLFHGEAMGKQRPGFSMKDMDGKLRNADEWNGKVLIVNFWATWCPPCRKEIPAFIELQDQYGDQGLQFVGIAIDDKDKVQDYIDTMGINYPVLVGEIDAIDLAKRYGNRFGALPFTAVVDRSGKIVFIQRGEFKHDLMIEKITPLL